MEPDLVRDKSRSCRNKSRSRRDRSRSHRCYKSRSRHRDRSGHRRSREPRTSAEDPHDYYMRGGLGSRHGSRQTSRSRSCTKHYCSRRDRDEPDPDDDDSDDPRRARRGRKDERRRCKHSPSSSDPSDSDSRSRSRSRNAKNTNFRPENIGFFDPYLNTSEYGEGDICKKGGKTYFRSVHLFLDSVRDYASLNSAKETRRQLSKCLRGTAAVWFMHQLTSKH